MTTAIERYLEQYNANDRKTWRGKPDNLVKIADIGGNYPSVWLYKAGKTAKVAVGCRRFTFEQAYDHWGSLDNVYSAWLNKAPNTIPDVHQQRAARSKILSETILTRAIKRARRLGWNTGGY